MPRTQQVTDDLTLQLRDMERRLKVLEAPTRAAYRVRVTREVTGQNFTAGVLATVSWDTERFDVGDWWDAADPTKLIVPVAGIALPIFNVTWAAETTERRRLSIVLNFAAGGSETLSVVRWDGVSTETTGQSVPGGWVQVLPNDYFIFQGRQDSPSTLALGGTSATNASVLLIPT